MFKEILYVRTIPRRWWEGGSAGEEFKIIDSSFEECYMSSGYTLGGRFRSATDALIKAYKSRDYDKISISHNLFRYITWYHSNQFIEVSIAEVAAWNKNPNYVRYVEKYLVLL